MDWSIIAAPLIGAVIGYATNYIAVKMLFRPRNPITIGKFTLPFTPGIVPKGKPRIAHAVGNVVGSSLLNEETLSQTLLSDTMKANVAHSVHEVLISLQENESTFSSILSDYVPEETLTRTKENAIDYVANRIDLKLQENPVGEFIANEVIKTVKESLRNGILKLIATDNVMSTISEKIQQGIDDYLAKNALNLVVPVITQECDHLLGKNVSNLGEVLASHEESIVKLTLQVYENLINNKLESMFYTLNVPSIIENKINEMDMKELEDLIFVVMRKELNAIVNLGALIGFILGLLNLLF